MADLTSESCFSDQWATVQHDSSGDASSDAEVAQVAPASSMNPHCRCSGVVLDKASKASLVGDGGAEIDVRRPEVHRQLRCPALRLHLTGDCHADCGDATAVGFSDR